jgi:hypothetical protein
MSARTAPYPYRRGPTILNPKEVLLLTEETDALDS